MFWLFSNILKSSFSNISVFSLGFLRFEAAFLLKEYTIVRLKKDILGAEIYPLIA